MKNSSIRIEVSDPTLKTEMILVAQLSAEVIQNKALRDRIAQRIAAVAMEIIEEEKLQFRRSGEQTTTAKEKMPSQIFYMDF